MPPADDQYALAGLFGDRRDELTRHTPHCQRLGMRVIEAAPRRAVILLPYQDDLVGDPQRGVVFGGAITTLLDHASGLSVFCSLEALVTIATLDLRIDYLRAAEPGCDLVGEAECYKRTKNVAFVRGLAYDRDRTDPFATCLATFMVGSTTTPTNLAGVVGKPGAS